MPFNHSVPVTNRLLDALPHKDCEQLLKNCQHIELNFADVLCRPGECLSYVYFPTGSFISLITPIDDNAGLEVGLIGNEGMFGITLMLGVNIAPFQALVQGAGSALRMTASAFLTELGQSATLQQKLKQYL